MFGTDGVRGTPGHEPLDADTVVSLGAAVAAELGDAPRAVCGRDTRDSGGWLEQHFAAGFHSEGGTVVSAGVMPTPAVSLIVASQAFDAGIVISASHNPYPDNAPPTFTSVIPSRFPNLTFILSDWLKAA